MAVDQTFRKTSIWVIDEELWAWAQYRAKVLKLRYPWIKDTSWYLFELVKKDREGKVIWD